MTRVLFQFSYLQVLDFLTTIAFLLAGVREGNPFVRLVLSVSPSPLVGLAATKALAVALGAWCWYMGRERLLGRINLMFALVVAWNLVALIAQQVELHSIIRALRSGH